MSDQLVQADSELPALAVGSILRGPAASAIAEAEGVLVAAREQAAKLIQEATTDAERLRQEGYQKGLREGLMEARVQNLETVAAISQTLAGLHTHICETVTVCLRTLLKELPPAERIQQSAALAMESVNLQHTIVLCVNPADLRAVAPVVQQLTTLMSGNARVECRGRDDIESGDCLLETPMGIIRCALEEQLAAINKALNSSED